MSEQKPFDFGTSIADMERAMREHAERMRIEMEHAIKERERLAFERIPDYRPNQIQRLMMEHVSELTGFAVIQDKGTSIEFVGKTMLTAKGCFTQARHNPKLPKDCIIMNTDSNDPYWYSVFFHEMAHATGVPKYLNRIGLSGEKTHVDYAFEELIAETVASQIMERMGYATDSTRAASHSYIQNWTVSFDLYARLLSFDPITGRGVIREIDHALLAKQVDDAKALVLQWIAEFDRLNIDKMMERIKTAHKFF